MKRKKIDIVIVFCLSLLLVSFLVYVLIGMSQMKKVPSLSLKMLSNIRLKAIRKL